MKLLLVLSVFTLAAALPPPNVKYPSDNVQVLKYENDNVGFGGYRYAYEQSDGTKQEQYGEVKNEGREGESLVVRGSFSWVGPDGVTYTITYVADEDGFQPDISQGPGGVIPLDVLQSATG